jgi:acyl-CoA synthetase (AMP-forming)/AMP-acid ligase II
VVMPDMDPRFPADADPKCILDVIRDRKPTTAFMQIPVIRNLQKYCEDHGEKIPHLKKILTTGASVPVDMVKAMHRVLAEPDADLHIMYGATEALCVSFATGRDLIAREEALQEGCGTYLGRPSASVTVKIIRIQDGPIDQWDESQVVNAGEIGEICVFAGISQPAGCHGKSQDSRCAWTLASHGRRGLFRPLRRALDLRAHYSPGAHPGRASLPGSDGTYIQPAPGSAAQRIGGGSDSWFAAEEAGDDCGTERSGA